MTLLNPSLLMTVLGGAALTVPVALHFFYRARYRPLPWAAMEFLRLSIEQTSRRLRFQELILLLLRIAVCALLLFALLRPASVALTSSGGRGESVDALIVIDTSYSMGAKEGDKTRLERAKDAAVKVIDNLPPNSSAQIIACSDKASSLTLRLPTNLDQARHLVHNLKISSQSTDFFPGFEEALADFKKTTGANKEVYLISDMQRSGWERQASAIRSKCEEIKDQASLYLVRCSEKNVKNVAIVGITPQTDIPHTGSRIAFTVLLKNSGADTVSDLQLSLEVDGKNLERDSRSVDRIAPGDTRAVTITGKIDQAGLRLLTARIKDDDLEEDNEFSRLLMVRDKTRVLVVDGRPDSRDPAKAASFFINHALLPVPEDQRGSYHVQVKTVRPEETAVGLLGDSDICILVDVAIASLRDDFTKGLDSFVRSGKGLLITPGENVVPREYNSALGELLPARLSDGNPFRAPTESPLKPDLTSADVQSFLAKFKEGGNNPLRDLYKADTYTIYPVDEKQQEAGKPAVGRALLRFDDGHAMLLSKSVGAGETMLLTSSVDGASGFLYLNVAFAPFINGCLSHLVQRSNASLNHVAGETVRWTPADPNRDYVVINPNGDRIDLPRLKEEKVIDASKAGVYQILGSNDQLLERFAVVPDLRESESLDSITDEQIDDQLGFKPIHLNTGFDGSSFTGTERSRKEWTIWVLGALLVFALGECLWAWVCGRAW